MARFKVGLPSQRCQVAIPSPPCCSVAGRGRLVTSFPESQHQPASALKRGKAAPQTPAQTRAACRRTESHICPRRRCWEGAPVDEAVPSPAAGSVLSNKVCLCFVSPPDRGHKQREPCRLCLHKRLFQPCRPCTTSSFQYHAHSKMGSQTQSFRSMAE